MKKISTYLFFYLLLQVFAFGCKEDEIDINNTADFELLIQQEMEDQHIPATAVLVFNGGTVLYEKYFGYSNVENSIALEEDHMFLIASISKVVTAIALLQLYDDGEFDLDDDINDYLSFSVGIPGYSESITFRQLLTHTSGIADNDEVMDSQYYYNEDPPISLGYFIENYLSEGGEFYNENANFHNFQPGTESEYSNIGSALIGVLVEQISGQGFNAYCKEHIFTPLGMENTSWRLDEITQTIVTPYDFISGENQMIPNYTNTDFPNGGLRTTAKDLFKLCQALMNNGQYEGVQLLNSSTVQAMRTPQIPSIDDEVGLHFFIMNKQNNIWGHDGGEQGVATIMGFNPQTNIGAIVLCNQGEAFLDEVFEGAYQLGTKL